MIFGLILVAHVILFLLIMREDTDFSNISCKKKRFSTAFPKEPVPPVIIKVFPVKRPIKKLPLKFTSYLRVLSNHSDRCPLASQRNQFTSHSYPRLSKSRSSQTEPLTNPNCFFLTHKTVTCKGIFKSIVFDMIREIYRANKRFFQRKHQLNRMPFLDLSFQPSFK